MRCQRSQRDSRVTKFLRNLPYWVMDDLLRVTSEQFAGATARKNQPAADLGNSAQQQRSDIRDVLGMWNAPESAIDWIEGQYEQQLAYKPQPYAGAVTILRARALPLLSPHRAPEFGWGEIGHESRPGAQDPGFACQYPSGALGPAARRPLAG